MGNSGVYQKYFRRTPPKGPIESKVDLNPASGIQYPYSNVPKGKMRIIMARIVCTWTVQPTPLEIHVTFKNGTLVTFTKTDPISGTGYNIYGFIAGSSLLTQPLEGTNNTVRNAFAFEGDIASIFAEITGGTVSNLLSHIIWQAL